MPKGPIFKEPNAEPLPENLMELYEAFSWECGGEVPLGYSSNPSDSIWLGEDFTGDPLDWIFDHLGKLHPLENILRAIVLAHPNSERGDEKREVENRVNRALKELVGRKPSEGARDETFQKLVDIARDWWDAYCETGSKPTLAPIIRYHAFEPEELASLNSDQIGKRIDRWRERINAEKDELFKIVTAESTEEQQTRRNREQAILELMETLDIAVITEKANPR